MGNHYGLFFVEMIAVEAKLHVSLKKNFEKASVNIVQLVDRDFLFLI